MAQVPDCKSRCCHSLVWPRQRAGGARGGTRSTEPAGSLQGGQGTSNLTAAPPRGRFGYVRVSFLQPSRIGIRNFPVKGQVVGISSSVGHTASVRATEPHCRGGPAAVDVRWTAGGDWVLMELTHVAGRLVYRPRRRKHPCMYPQRFLGRARVPLLSFRDFRAVRATTAH